MIHMKFASILFQVRDCQTALLPELNHRYSTAYWDLKWETKMGSVDDMINGIDTVYHIMFVGLIEMREIYDSIKSHALNEDISAIIVDYLWISLPTTDNVNDYFVEFTENENAIV